MLGTYFDLPILETPIALALLSSRAVNPRSAGIGLVFEIGRVALYGIAEIALGTITIVVLEIIPDKIVMVTVGELSKKHKIDA